MTINKITLFLTFFLVISFNCKAAPRTKAQAKAIAEKLAEKIGTVVYSDAVASKRARVRKAETDEIEAYYIFNYGTDEGFIIVSGDDRMPEIVGYTDTGAYDETNMPKQFKEFLEAYTRTVTAVAEGNVTATENVNQASTPTTMTVVMPLLGNNSWDQDAPYNLLCPTVNGEQTVTGCAATAMAQIMRYHKYPVNQVDIAGYTTESHKISIPKVTASDATEDQYDWDNMLLEYTSSATELQKNAVAKLMYHAGVALKMDYGLASKGGSGAYTTDIYPAFATFGYDTTLLQQVDREDYSYAQWRDIIVRELNAKRPISYNGQSSGGGHSFVCDGIDADGLVHINWGWSGLCNGYFDVAILNPGDNSGIGASTTTDGYNGYNTMIIGITPHNTSGETKVEEGSGVTSSWDNISVSIASGEADGKLYYNTQYTYYNKVNFTIKNNDSNEFYATGYLCYEDPSNSKSYIFASISPNLNAGEGKTYTLDVEVPTLKNGERPTNLSYYLITDGYDIVKSQSFGIATVDNPVLSITSITSNASSDLHAMTYKGNNVLMPSVKDNYAKYNVTITNTGGDYRGNIIYVGFYDPTVGYFSAAPKIVEIPNGETTLSFTDNNLVYGQIAGILLWSSSEFSEFLSTSKTQTLEQVGTQATIDYNNRFVCYAEGPTKQVTIAAANHSSNDNCYYSTLYLDYAVIIPDGVKAYTAEIKQNSKIILKEIEESVIPAYTGVVLEMPAKGDYDFTATSTDITIGSDLQGVLAETPTSAVLSTPYVLNINDAGKPVFRNYSGTYLHANKAYLILPSSAKSFSFGFENEDVDGIKMATTSAEANDGRYYNLQGMSVDRPSKGLYIKNGKKIIIR